MRITALFSDNEEHAPLPVTSAPEAAAATAAAAAVSAPAASSGSQPQVPARTRAASGDLPEINRQKQFSLHIIRCNCMLKMPPARRTSRSRLGRNQTSLALDVPDFSLQLPPSDPCALLAPLPAEEDHFSQAAELHFNAGASRGICSGSSLRVMLAPTEENDPGPLISIPAASAALSSAVTAEQRQEGPQLSCHIPSFSSHLDVKQIKALASLIQKGLQDWNRLSAPTGRQSSEDPACVRPDSPRVPQAHQLPIQTQVDIVEFVVRSADQRALLLTCKALGLHRLHDSQDHCMRGRITFSKLQIEYSVSDQGGPINHAAPVRSSSPQDEFMQPAQLGRTFSAPLGSEVDSDRVRRSKRLTRRHSRDSPTLMSRPQSGLLDSSSHSGSFSNMPGIKPARDTGSGEWPSGLMSRRALLPSMVRAPSRLNKWLQQLPASHEDQSAGHGLTAAFYGAGSSSGSIGDVTEILDPADLEQESEGSIWDLGEQELAQEGPAFERALLLSVEGMHSPSANLEMIWKNLTAQHQLQLAVSLRLTLFSQVLTTHALSLCAAYIPKSHSKSSVVLMGLSCECVISFFLASKMTAFSGFLLARRCTADHILI